MIKIIGLTGPAGAGKDTVAQMLRDCRQAYTLAFADTLRSEVLAAFVMDPHVLLCRDTKEHPITALALKRCYDPAFYDRMLSLGHDPETPRSPRQIMQWWGTDYRRNIDSNYWINAAQARINLIKCHAEMMQMTATIVLTDVRFANEAEMVRAIGGEIWQIKRPGLQSVNAHISETTGSEFAPDVVINNRHDIKHLKHLVLQAVETTETEVAHGIN